MRHVLRVRLPRPQRHARRVERQGRGDRFALQLLVDRRQIADENLVGIDRAGGEHLHAGDGDARVVLRHHLQVRIVALLAGKQIGALSSARRRHGEAEIEIVAAGVVVILQQVLAAARTQGVEQARVHRKSRNQPRHLIGRAADETIGEIGDRLAAAHAAREIVAAPAAQPVEADRLTVAVEGEQLAPGRIGLEVVEPRNGSRAFTERRMRGDVVDTLGADIDGAAVAHALELFRAGNQHAATSAPSATDWRFAAPAASARPRPPRSAWSGRSPRAARSRRGPSARSPGRSAPRPDRSRAQPAR